MSRSLQGAPKPFLKWAGGKRDLASTICDIALSEPFNRYYEPFIGGGAVFFALRSQLGIPVFPATIGDVNKRLTCTYLGVKFDVEGVIKQLDKMRYDKDEYYARRLQVFDLSSTSAAVAAWVIYMNKCGFNGLWRVNKSGQFNVPFGTYTNPKICDAPTLRTAALALSNTQIVHADFEEQVKEAQAGDFVYFDPPYVPRNKTSNFTSYTADGFTIKDQKRLRNCILQLRERGVRVVLSNADVPEVLELYGHGFRVQRVAVKRRINSKASARGAVGEVIIT